MSNRFENVKKNFGFGCMRLPMNGEEVDQQEFTRMVDTFLEAGFNYFDTARGYLKGKSETAIRECLVKRYPRESFILTDKLTEPYFETEEDIRPFFESQLEACGVSYFDFYLMHAQNAENYKKFQKCHAYETAQRLKEEGKVRHVGISFHDSAEVLDRILTDHPELEVVQLQFNYADYLDEEVQSKACYDVCRKHGKPVIVMEPVKGGKLIRLPKKAQDTFDALHGGTNASYAIRFAASFDNVMMVLSGMSDMEQMNDNLSFMTRFQPLTPEEQDAVKTAAEIFNAQKMISCTTCRYCTDGCPKQIPIPEIFNCVNDKIQYENEKSKEDYQTITKEKGKASDCIQCGKCEKACPQHLQIRQLLKDAARMFE